MGLALNYIDKDGQQHNLPGDYLYYMTIGALDLNAGSWGLFRVSDDIDIKPLDDKTDVVVGGDPCEGREIRSYNVTAIDVPVEFAGTTTASTFTAKNMFVLAKPEDGTPRELEADYLQPLVLRARSGECVQVTLHAHHMGDSDRRVSLTAGLVVADPKTSSGVNIGTNLKKGGVDQSVGSSAKNPGTFVTYTWFTGKQAIYDLSFPEAGDVGGVKSWTGERTGMQEKELGSIYLASMVDPVKDLNDGLFGALIVEPEDALWITEGEEGNLMGDVVADVLTPEGDFREFVVILHEQSDIFTSSFRPQAHNGENQALNFSGSINYRRSLRTGPAFTDVGNPGFNTKSVNTVGSGFRDGRIKEIIEKIKERLGKEELDNGSTKVGPDGINNGLVFEAKAGVPTRVRLIYANGSEDRQFTIHGHRWHSETATANSNSLSVVGMGVGMRYDLELLGNGVDGDASAAPGVSRFPGDYFLGVTEIRSAGDHKPNTDDNNGGQWGVIRVKPDEG